MLRSHDQKIGTIRTIETENFRVRLDALAPSLSLERHFGDTAIDVQEVRNDINAGRQVHFDARCTVEHKPTGTTLGKDHLCGCVYKSFRDFVECRGYAPDMIREAIKRARRTIDRISSLA